MGSFFLGIGFGYGHLFSRQEPFVIHGPSAHITAQTGDNHVSAVMAVRIVDAFQRPLRRLPNIFIKQLDGTPAIKTQQSGVHQQFDDFAFGDEPFRQIELFVDVLGTVAIPFMMDVLF